MNEKITSPTSQKRLLAGLALVAIAGFIVTAAVLLPQTNTVVLGPSGKSALITDTSVYKDGTYSATGSYVSPGGKEQLHVSLTLASNVISTVDVVTGANDPTAVSYQHLFESGYKSYVVGKKINSLKLSNVAGSSLTPQGFNDALKQIEQQAKTS